MNKIEFGQYLKKLRKDKDLTLMDLAKMSGVSNPYISQIENGKFSPTPEILKKLSKGLEVEHWKLMQLAGFTDKKSLLDELTLKAIHLDQESAKAQHDINQIVEKIGALTDRPGDEETLSNLKDLFIKKKRELTTYNYEKSKIAHKINEIQSELHEENQEPGIAEFQKDPSFSDLLNFGLASSNRFNEVKNDIVAQDFKSFPVNDLNFHLSDPHNKKLYKKVVLSDEDRANISAMIESYLLRKYVNTEKGEHQEELISMLTSDLEIEDGYRNEDYRKKNKNGLSAF